VKLAASDTFEAIGREWLKVARVEAIGGDAREGRVDAHDIRLPPHRQQRCSQIFALPWHWGARAGT
jgi:hypothetical protein